MTTTRAAAIAGWATLVVVVVVAGLWAWKPWAGTVWVPTCADLTEVLPQAAGGAWSVSDNDPGRDTTQSSAQCELAFAATDQRFAGTVRVFISTESDTDLLRRRVAEEPCDGPDEPTSVPGGYQALRSCSAVVGDFANATVIAAKDDRWLRMTASTSIRDDNRNEVLPFSRDLVRKAAEQGLALREGQ